MPFFTEQRALHRSIGGKDHASVLIAPILFDGENLNDKIPLQQKPRFSIILSVQLSVTCGGRSWEQKGYRLL
jgi:hypothetical protein